jgi:hypothetical protein
VISLLLLDKDGNPTINKVGAEILSKLSLAGKYKVGDKIKYKRDKGEEATTTITKIEGNKWHFTNKDGDDVVKDGSSIIDKVGEGEEAKAEEAKPEGEAQAKPEEEKK